MSNALPTRERWYQGVTGYQWLVLAIASAGWVFDIYEGQIFNITRADMLKDLGQDEAGVKFWGDAFLGIFLAGGTIGGLLAGTLADRYGRRPIMVLTILFYSIFSGLTYFVTSVEQVAILRFLVAMGIGGEWAVAASLVAEVFPKKARAQASGIFHASSVLGTFLAAGAGIMVGTNWRFAYLLGILPAVLVLWVRASVKEPERWQAKKSEGGDAQLGSFKDLLTNPQWNKRAFLGMALAAVGLATFWGVTVGGQQLAKAQLEKEYFESVESQLAAGVSMEQQVEEFASTGSRAKFAYGFLQTAGGGLGLLLFGPLCARFGRRKTFIWMHIFALVIVPITCFVPQSFSQLQLLLPVFGFFTLAMHAGYAIYFPELFPTHVRATGTSFCFNGGRAIAVPMLFFSGWLKGSSGLELPVAISLLGTMFLAGAFLMLFLPETKGQDLID